jgi:hypothetical protein
MNYINAAKRPFTSLKRLCLGILLNIIPLINFFTCGYIIECALSPKKELPEWKNWGSLFIKGFYWTVINISYSIIPIAFMLLSFGTKIFNEQNLASAIKTNLELGITAGLIAGISLYLTPSAILSFAYSGKLRNAFKSEVFSRAITMQYLKSIITASIIFIASSIVLGIIVSLTGGNAGAKLVSIAVSSFITEVTLFTLLGEQR